MTAEPGFDGVLSALTAALSEGRLPPRARASAERLRERLTSPVRLVIMGRRGAGKTTLANVLSGADILPVGIDAPICQIRRADTPAMVVTLADGTRSRIDGDDLQAALDRAPLMIEIERPLSGLAEISLLDLVTDGSPAELVAASRWAAKRAEMAIWVTRDFDDEEQAIWHRLPEALQDHAFLVLNGIDAHTPEEARRRIAAHRQAGQHTFLGVFPVSARTAAAGLSGGEGSGRTAGCGALLDAVRQRVDLGRQADLDTALAFLSRHGAIEAVEGPGMIPPAPSQAALPGPAHDGGDLASSVGRAGVPGPAPADAPDVPEAEPEPYAPERETPASDPDATAGSFDAPLAAPDPSATAPELPAEDRATDNAEPMELSAIPAAPPALRLGALDVLDAAATPADTPGGAEAVTRLRRKAASLLADAQMPETDALIRALCETVEQVSDLLPVGTAAEDTALRTADFLTLLQLESTPSVAEDAAAALVQLRRDLDLAIAA